MKMLGRLRLPEHARMLHPGVAQWENPGNKFTILAIHDSADPAKGSLDWKAEASIGYTEALWQREHDMDFDSWAGLPVYLSFEQNAHVSPVSLFPLYSKKNYIWRGWDIGIHACVWMQLVERSLYVFASRQIAGSFGPNENKYKESEIFVSGLSAFIQSCKELSEEWFPRMAFRDIGDPSIFNNTVEREKKPIDTFLENGITLEPGETQDPTQRVDGVELWLEAMVRGRAAFQIDPTAKVIIDGFAGGYRREKEGAGAKPEKKSGFSHPMDCIQYAVSRMPTKPFSKRSELQEELTVNANGFYEAPQMILRDEEFSWMDY